MSEDLTEAGVEEPKGASSITQPTLTTDPSPDSVEATQIAADPFGDDPLGEEAGAEPQVEVQPPPAASSDALPEPEVEDVFDEPPARDLTEAELARIELADAEADLELKRQGLKAAEKRYSEAALNAERFKHVPTLHECNEHARRQSARRSAETADVTEALRRLLPRTATAGARRPTPPMTPVGGAAK